MKKIILLSLFALNAYAVDSSYSKGPQGTVKFGGGLITMECHHVDGSQDILYAFATNSKGYCPGIESDEYVKAAKDLYGIEKKHNENLPTCRDETTHLDPWN